MPRSPTPGHPLRPLPVPKRACRSRRLNPTCPFGSSLILRPPFSRTLPAGQSSGLSFGERDPQPRAAGSYVRGHRLLGGFPGGPSGTDPGSLALPPFPGSWGSDPRPTDPGSISLRCPKSRPSRRSFCRAAARKYQRRNFSPLTGIWGRGKESDASSARREELLILFPKCLNLCGVAPLCTCRGATLAPCDFHRSCAEFPVELSGRAGGVVLASSAALCGAGWSANSGHG